MKISMPTPSPLARYHQVLLAVSKRSGGLNLNGLNRDTSLLHTPERAAAGHRHRGLQTVGFGRTPEGTKPLSGMGRGATPPFFWINAILGAPMDLSSMRFFRSSRKNRRREDVIDRGPDCSGDVASSQLTHCCAASHRAAPGLTLHNTPRSTKSAQCPPFF